MPRTTESHVLIIGVDETSNGGIASVVKSHVRGFGTVAPALKCTLVRTNYYHDKGKLHEIRAFGRAFVLVLYKLATGRVTVVHVHSSHAISFARKTVFACLARCFNKPVIFHIHSSRFEEFFLSKSKVRRAWVQFVFRRCDMVVVLCERWRAQIASQYPDTDFRVLSNPIPPPKTLASLQRAESEETFVILFLGFLIRPKGIFDLVEVAARCRRQRADVKFVVGGKGPEESSLRRHIESAGLQDTVQFAGWIDAERKPVVMQDADLFFLPSSNEGMPISILEAMSYGLPIVSTTVAGIPEIVQHGDNGYLFEPGAVDEFAGAICELSRSPALVRQLGEASRTKARRHYEANVSRELLQLYSEVEQRATKPKELSHGGRA